MDEIRQSWRGGRERFHAAGLGMGAIALAHLAIKHPMWHRSLALFGINFGMRLPEAFVGVAKHVVARYAAMPDADVDAWLGRTLGTLFHPAATAQMRERALAATVGPGREFAQTRLSFLTSDVFGALTNVLAYDKIRQPTILVQVRPPQGCPVPADSLPLAPVTVAARDAARGRPRGHGARGAYPGAAARRRVRDAAAHRVVVAPRESGPGQPDSSRLCAQASRVGGGARL